jgi:hypothetical protein
MKLTNPLQYPLAMLAGGIFLVISVRFWQLPKILMIPVAGGIATIGAVALKAKEQASIDIENPALEKELQTVKEQAKLLLEKAEILRSEAEKMLTTSAQIELLTAVQYGCDLAGELPAKIEILSRQLHGSDSLLSVTDLQQQQKEAQEKLKSSSGVARQKIQQLIESLQRNVELAQQGHDARQAQIISLSTLTQDSAGVLQELQNKLRTSNLNNSEEIQELLNLSSELSSMQENVDLLISS